MMGNEDITGGRLFGTIFALAIGSGALGAIIGYLAVLGRMEPLVTVLTTIITAGGVGAGGLGLFSGFKLNGHITTKVVPSINVAVFAVFFFISTIVAENVRGTAIDVLRESFNAISYCSVREAETKKLRETLKLEPLKDICKEWADVNP